MKFFKKFNLKKISELETIEEKSFWIVAPAVVAAGFLGLLTSSSYTSVLPIVTAEVFCILFPLVLMLIVYKKKNYHVAYPILCISIGALAMPVCFILGGGFLSSVPLFCVVTTGISVLCYSDKLRYVSFISCLASNTVAFWYVYKYGVPFPIAGSESIYADMSAIHPLYNDIFFGYYLASLALFFAVNFIVTDIRRYKLNQDALQQFFDKEKKNSILKKIIGDNISIGSEHKKAAIVFADISNFTSITESMPEDIILKFLNEFFSAAGTYIHETGGIIDKYIGDCVMAYWIDDGSGDCVFNAVKSMLDLKLELFRRAEDIFKTYNTELNFTVGISYGNVIFGDIGSGTMHDYTLIGDAVNTASRIESFAAGGEMLISDSAAKMLKNAVILEKVESGHFFKGKNKPTDIYRISGLASEKPRSGIDEHMTYGYRLHICGCRGSFPVSGLRFSEYGGETTCYTLRKDDRAVIVDCGTGLKNAIKLIEGCKTIDILLTHLHYDHILGLLTSQFPEGASVRIWGCFSKWNSGTDTIARFMERPYWPVGLKNIEKKDVETDSEYRLSDELSVTFFPSDHPDNACVIKLMCRDRKVVFLFDCEKATSLPVEISDNSELLFFDGMYDDNDAVDRKGWGHGTWQDGVRFAQSMNIKKLVISHHNPEFGDHTLMLKEAEARSQCSKVSFAKTGDIFYI